jgi:hypothetical protein
MPARNSSPCPSLLSIRFPAWRVSLSTRTLRQTQVRRAVHGGAGGWRFHPCGQHRGLPRSSTRVLCLSDGQLCRPCWQSHAAWRDPSTQIHDLPWPRCPSRPPVRSCSRLSRRLELSPASATEVPRCTAIRLEMIDLLRFTGVASMGNMGESIAVPGHIGARRVGRATGAGAHSPPDYLSWEKSCPVQREGLSHRRDRNV